MIKSIIIGLLLVVAVVLAWVVPQRIVANQEGVQEPDSILFDAIEMGEPSLIDLNSPSINLHN